MKVDKQALLKCLKTVAPGLAAKEIIEQSTSFIFQNGQVIAYNDEIAVHAPLMGELEIEGAIPAKELVAILNRFKGEEVDITVSENELLLKCGKQRAGIRLAAEITLPMDELKIPDQWISLPPDFHAGLVSCIPSAARDLTYPILATIHLTSDYVEATDNNRITRYTWDLDSGGMEVDQEGILLPVEAATALARLAVTDFCDTEGWIHFTNDSGVVFSCRTSNGEYPDLSSFLEIDPVGQLEFPAGIKDMLDGAGVFLSSTVNQDNSISIGINEKGLMTVRGEGEYGWYEESCRVDWNGDEGIAFSVHPAHLLAILSGPTNIAHVSADRIAFETENFIHLVALEA